jgi:hypothetical protein
MVNPWDKNRYLKKYTGGPDSGSILRLHLKLVLFHLINLAPNSVYNGTNVTLDNII